MHSCKDICRYNGITGAVFQGYTQEFALQRVWEIFVAPLQIYRLKRKT